MSEIVSEPNIELENVFQQIFMECDTSFSTSMTYSTLSLDEEVPISRIVQYVQDQLPIWSIEHMLELWKCLSDVSTNDRVNSRQFKEATKCWIAKVLQTQDDNNNIKRKLYNTWNARQPGCKEQSDSRRSTSIADWWCLEKLIGGSQRAKSMNDTTTMDSMKMEIDKDIAEVELRMRVRKFDEENIILREELARAEDLIASLERQRNNLENQLDRYTKKCQQLEKENDEQKDKLNEMMKNQKSYVSAYQRSAKKYESLSKKLEVAEIEMQAIQPLREEMEKISKEKRSCVKLVTRLQEEFYEKEEECEKLRVTMAELQDINNSMKETYEYTISNLRERNRQLTDENMELQSWAALQGETFSLSPNPNADGCYPHSISYKLEKVSLDNSLYAELRASGFTAECSSRNSCRLELEEELGYYDTVISATLQQLDKIIQTCAETTDSTDAAQLDSPHTEDTRVHNIETLKHKVALLLDTVTKKTRNRDTKDSSTQLRADCSDAIENSGQFGAMSFRARLVGAHQCPEPDLRSTASQDAIDNEDNPFLKVIQAKASVLEDLNIIEVIDPLVDELDRIIEQTVNSPVVYKDLPASGSSRYKSIYTLPSYSRACSPGAEDARRVGSCQGSRKNSLDIALASGDGPTGASCDRKSAEFETRAKCDASDRERPSLHIEETLRRPSEVRAKKPSALRMDSETLVTPEKKTSAMNFQAPEVIVTSPLTSSLTSARRKFSVYHRSFDVVEVRDPHEDDREPCLEVRRSPSDSLVRNDGTTKFGDVAVGNEVVGDRARDQNGAASRYLFSHYRDARNDSDSSNNCSPQKRSSSDEPSPIAAQQPILRRRVHLAPTRLKLPREIESRATACDDDLAKKCTKDCAPPSGSSDVPGFSSAVDKCEEDDDDDVSVHSSSTFIVADKCETAVDAALESNSCSANKTFSQGHLTSAPSIPHNRMDPTKIADPEDPHSRTSVRRRVDGDQPHVERSVDSQMSSREDTSADDEDSECESARPSDRCVDGRIVAMGANEAGQTANVVLPLIGSPMKKMPCGDAMQDDGETQRNGNLLVTKQERQQSHLMMRRSFSEGDNVNNGQILCCCKQHDGSQTAPLIPTDSQSISFPSLTNARLRESGIANLPDTEINSRENLSEFELQKRYTAFSLCLCTDRVTLSRRMEVSLRQRDQSERNLTCEVQKMQQDIQELAPLCTDRESVERVERVRHQLDMVARCAHRVSCAAETLGAVHEEHRISRAVFVADRYLQLLQSRCEKLAANVVETKRILTENNIVIEEISGELGDDLPRTRYRSGTPANNRMMMARRRASIATMSRPMGSTQDVIKDTVRQRNSVSGRMTLRRPSLNYESSKLENERLGRTDSSNSIGELRGIFEHAESRRGSKEENNNMLRLNQSNSQSIINCAIIDDEIWTNLKQETCTELLSVDENASRDCRPCARSTSQSFRLRGMIVSWRVMLWGILFFFLGFYVNRVVSMVNTCYTNDPVDQWLINWIFKGYVRTNVTPHPT